MAGGRHGVRTGSFVPLVVGLILGCTGDEDEQSAPCIPANVADEVQELAGPHDIDRCALDAIDEVEAVLLEHAATELADAAEAYAADDRGGVFQSTVTDVSATVGWYVDQTNRARIEAANGDGRTDEERAATDRYDDGRCRAGVMVWDALREAERRTGNEDLLSETQRTAWHEIADDQSYLDMTPEQQDALCDAQLDYAPAATEVNWGDMAEDAFTDSR